MISIPAAMPLRLEAEQWKPQPKMAPSAMAAPSTEPPFSRRSIEPALAVMPVAAPPLTRSRALVFSTASETVPPACTSIVPPSA